MPVLRVNGVGLHYERRGTGDPLVLVHGSWGDHHNWDPVVDALAQAFDVVAYDRRGHSASERPLGQGSVLEDPTTSSPSSTSSAWPRRTSPATPPDRSWHSGRGRGTRRPSGA